jgi:hypothetical protein
MLYLMQIEKKSSYWGGRNCVVSAGAWTRLAESTGYAAIVCGLRCRSILYELKYDMTYRIRDYVSVLPYHVDDLLCSRIYEIGPALNFDWPVSWVLVRDEAICSYADVCFASRHASHVNTVN